MALWLAGMSLFDAVLPLDDDVGGRRVLAASGVAGWLSRVPTIQWIITVFMFIAGVNFALQVRVARGNGGRWSTDEEFRAYAGVVVVASRCSAVRC